MKSNYLDEVFVASEEKNVPFNILSWSQHNAYEIYILLEGERRVFIGETAYPLKGGEAMLVRSEEVHRSEGTTPYRGVCLKFTEKYLDKYFSVFAKRRLLACFQYAVISLDKDTLSQILLLLYKMEEEQDDKFMYLAALLGLFGKKVRESEAPEKESSRIDFKNITHYLDENYRTITGLDEIASRVGITKEYLCVLFKKQTGMTIVTYLNNIRIQEACRLLEKTQESVENISEQCGFQSTVYFYRLFKKMMNHTPLQYRKMVVSKRKR